MLAYRQSRMPLVAGCCLQRRRGYHAILRPKTAVYKQSDFAIELPVRSFGQGAGETYRDCRLIKHFEVVPAVRLSVSMFSE